MKFEDITFEQFEKLVTLGYLEHRIIDGRSHYRITDKGEQHISSRNRQYVKKNDEFNINDCKS